MANTMTTYVRIVNLDTDSHKKFKELFSTPENSSFVDTFDNLNKMYGVKFDELNGPSRDWMEENVGSKYIEIELNSPVVEGEFSSEEYLILNTAWTVPTEYLQKLVEVLGKDNKEVAVYGTYEDESYNPIGAFVYADDYDDIEDLYEEDELDMNEMFEDDDYREKIYEELYSHRDSLYEGYLEVKKEREEDSK